MLLNIHYDLIAKELNVTREQVATTVHMLQDGATIPFISRYRKERTGNLNEVQIEQIKILSEKYEHLEKRRLSILESIEEQAKMTPELKSQIEKVFEINELEDLYLPYKIKRRTKATVAREKGLEPLAKMIMEQREEDINKIANAFVKESVKDINEAVSGARDIIAEWISEDKNARTRIRNRFERTGMVIGEVAKDKEDLATKYRDYYDFSQPMKNIPSHRLLALMRGANEGLLKFGIEIEEDEAIEDLEKMFVKNQNATAKEVKKAVKESYKRLILPSIENEFTNLAKEKADLEAIRIFAENLRQLLLSPPLGQKNVLALDPGFRTGCKVVCIDRQGNLKHNEAIYPHPPQNERKEAAAKILQLVESYHIEAIAIGNGTAGRETESFIQNIPFKNKIKVFVVDESGASIYSASELARKEFPDYDITVRGAVSIGRRLLDPLAELVKIDPKSVGVGQYQHDVDQSQLKNSLHRVVESCVNLVGVNPNTASAELLKYVSGLSDTMAQNIVDFRKKTGDFDSRNALKNVPRLGAKAFEQCAGFLRIPEAKYPLDNTAIHPELYPIVEKMAKSCKSTLEEFIKNEEIRKQIDLNLYITKDFGLVSLQEMMNELSKPNLDPRKEAKVIEFQEDLKTIDDLKVGMIVPGLVNNITNFGVFVDLGVKHSGFIHISQLANKFVKNPMEIVKLRQEIKVKIIGIEKERNRIQLSLKDVAE